MNMTPTLLRKAEAKVRALLRAGMLVKAGDGKFALPKLPEKMNPHLALFNCHVNKANRRAKVAFIEKYGKAVWDKQLQPKVTTGIMVILQEPPTKYTRFYVNTVTKFVNEDRY